MFRADGLRQESGAAEAAFEEFLSSNRISILIPRICFPDQRKVYVSLEARTFPSERFADSSSKRSRKMELVERRQL